MPLSNQKERKSRENRLKMILSVTGEEDMIIRYI